MYELKYSILLIFIGIVGILINFNMPNNSNLLFIIGLLCGFTVIIIGIYNLYHYKTRNTIIIKY